VLKTGDTGVCQPLTQCTTAVYQALHNDMPIVCSIKENMPIVCCARSPTVRLQPQTHQNIIQKQNPPQFTSQHYLFDTGTHEPPTDSSVRHSRGDTNEPWWLIEKPFAEIPPAPLQKPQSSNNNNGNTNHHQGISRPGNLQNQWWYSERPFSSAIRHPPPPPPSPSQKPITEPVYSQTRRNGQERISEISKLNPNIQKSCSRFVFVLMVVLMRLVRYTFFWDITLDHWNLVANISKPN